MFAVIFEIRPRPERRAEYLAVAAELRPVLERMDGFIDNERFASLGAEDRILSLSIWRDEKALVRWRTLALHHRAQERGRGELFIDYHLRVGEIVADSHAPVGPFTRLDETETGPAKTVTLTEWTGTGAIGAGSPLDPATAGLIESARFESIATAGKFLLLAGWRDQRAAAAWRPSDFARDRQVRIIRDYGMRDRREAPQYYSPLPE
jgi:heme-degrading monooxygenase HmoA